MDDKKDYGYLSEDMYKVEFLQQSVQTFIENGIGLINPNQASDIEKKVMVEYFHHFYALMEYQAILYTRLKLMADPKLVGIIDAILMICESLGRQNNETVIEFHLNMKEECKTALSTLTGEDMDDYEGIDVDFQW
mgnify:CR=1 FL=1